MRGALLAILLSKSFVALAANNCRLVFPADYASQAVPTDEPLKIEVDLSVDDIREVNELTGFFSIDIIAYITWHDPRFSDINTLRDCKGSTVDAKDAAKVWTPDLYLYDLLEQSGFSASSGYLYFKIEGGVFHKWLKFYAKVSCVMDFVMYPFDEQWCSFRIGAGSRNASYETYTSSMTFNPSKATVPRYAIGFHPLKSNLSYSRLSDEHHSFAGFRIHAERHLQPYVMNVYLPTGALVAISFIGFLIPVEQIPGRMALIITIFLMLINVSASERYRGPLAKAMTALEIWLLICMFIVSLTLVEFAGLLILHHRRGKRTKIFNTLRLGDPNEKSNVRFVIESIDWWAFWTFLAVFGLVVSIYWGVYLSTS